MNTLWTFGDSQTFGHGCRIDGPLTEYYFNYKKEGDDVWPTLLANKLGTKVVNCGKCGASNDYIIDSIIDNFNKINEGDYVIVGKTAYQRFDVPDFRNNELYCVFGEMPIFKDKSVKSVSEKWLKEISRTQEEFETLINFIYFFAQDKLYEKRQNKRFSFIKNRLLNEKNISFYYEWMIYDDFIKNNIQTIMYHSKNKFNDTHFSFNGHRTMSDVLYNIITTKKTII